MTVRRWLLTAAALFALAQLVPVPRANPPVEGEVDAPPEAGAVLERSCYDCHSNRTRWPGTRGSPPRPGSSPATSTRLAST